MPLPPPPELELELAGAVSVAGVAVVAVGVWTEPLWPLEFEACAFDELPWPPLPEPEG